MKVNNLVDLKPFDSWTSGSLNPKYYDDYATYFVKYVEAMRELGLEITAITMQNEPLNRGNSASLFMTWQEQKEFVKVLGAKMRDARIKTEIIAFDHNFNYDVNKPECRDQVGYPLHIYDDPEAAQYIVGAAYHAYGGSKEELKRVRDARPDKAIYFTEQSIGEWNYSFGGDLMWFMREIAIGTLNYDCKAVIVWNFMLDDQKGPYRPGGCDKCYGAVNLSTNDYKSVERFSHFYEIGHLAKVFKPGAVRVDLSLQGNADGFHAVAARNPDGSYALVALNETDATRTLRVAVDGEYLGHIIIADMMKDDAKQAIDNLHAAGVKRTVMLTGDRKEVAEAVARELGVDEVRAQLMPQDKVDAVESLLETNAGTNHNVAFVGDGINDAPVLMRADVGIAMGGMGSDAAIEAADIVLMDDKPSNIARAIRIARKTLRIVRQNIVFALAVKVVIMILALPMIGIANMWLAVFGDVGVSVLAILNAMRCLSVKE